MNDIHELECRLRAAEERRQRAMAALAPKHQGGEWEEYHAANQEVLLLERQLAAAKGEEYAEPCGFPLRWDAGAPMPHLMVNDHRALLAFLLSEPVEVFSVANRFTEPAAFGVLTVAEDAGPVLARGGLSVNPQHRLPDCPRPDLLLVPGGQGTRREMHNPALIDWIRQASERAEIVLSVCTGALLLAKVGLLDGLGATTHHGAIDLLRQTAPKTTVHANRRFVDNGRVICSAGIAAGIDMSLHVVSRLLGREVAVKTAGQMEYPWQTL